MIYIHLLVGSEFYTGHYFVEKEPEYNGKKIFYGAGVTFEIALNNEFELGIVHFAGIRTSLNYEDGSYFDFREIASENSKIENLNTGHFFGSYALFQEFVPYRDKLPFGYSLYLTDNLKASPTFLNGILIIFKLSLMKIK